MTGVRLIVFLLVVACLIGVVVLLGSAQCRPEVESNDAEGTADGLGTYPGAGCRSGSIFPAGDECPWKEEPNDSAAQADVLSAPRGSACRSGAVTPAGDVDVCSFALTWASRGS